MTNEMTHELSLSAINSDQDIRLFLRSQFHSIHHDKQRLMKDIPLPWPSFWELGDIVELVNGSFIFASTLVKYVREGSPPPLRLKPIVEAHTGVDGMYREILNQFLDDEHFWTVFSTVILLRRPLSVTGLGSLLNFGNRLVLFELLKIQSILHIPDDDHKAVDIFHTSLRDFSTSSQRAGTLCVKSSENHLPIVRCCWQIMVTQAEQFLFKGEAARYASCYWIKHFHLAFKDADSHYGWYNSLVEEMELLIMQCFQTWFNTMLDSEGYSSIGDKMQLLLAVFQISKVGLLLWSHICTNIRIPHKGHTRILTER